MLSNIDLSNKRTFQRSPLVRPADYSSRNWAGTTGSLAWHRTTPPSADGWRNSEMGGYSTGSRAAADLAQPAPWCPSDRWSGPSGRSGPSVRSPTVLLGRAPDHQCRYPARVVPTRLARLGRYTKFRDDRPMRSRVILGKPEGGCIPLLA